MNERDMTCPSMEKYKVAVVAGGKQLRRAEARQYALNGGKKEYEGGSDCADDKPTAEYGLPQAGTNGFFHVFLPPFRHFG